MTPAIRLATAAAGPGDAAPIALLVVTVTVFVPAAVLSAVPPMVVKLVLSTLTETGSVVGRLSGVSTLGAILATFLTGFVLVAYVPTSVILFGTGWPARRRGGSRSSWPTGGAESPRTSA